MTFLIAAVLLPLTLLTGFFSLEVFLGLPSGRRRKPAMDRAKAGRAVIVMPAHNEEEVITDTLDRLVGSLPAQTEILVVADNCTDATAAIAREKGVAVVERFDAARRGKGYALDYGRTCLKQQPPDVVVVLDADCTISRESLQALIGATSSAGRPQQAVYLLRAPDGADPKVLVSCFAFLLKNLVRQRGLQRLAGRVHLTGTGMAIQWHHFASADLATSNVVEDIRLGLELADSGYPPALAEAAVVWSEPASAAGTLVQRARWEGGYLETASQTVPELLGQGLRRLSGKRIAAALDLAVPPLALLAMLNLIALTVAALLLAIAGGDWWPILLHLAICLCAAAAVLAVWWKEGRTIVPFSVILRIPAYVLWKIPLYLGLARKGAPKDWVRTER